MAHIPYPRLVMLGPDPQSRGAVAGVLEAYRAHGLFRSWPIEYLATHGDGGVRSDAAAALKALRRLIALVVQERRLVLHLHSSAGWGFWRDALFMALALAARCPLILHLHGGGYERLRDGAGTLGTRVMRFLLERAACVVVPCESLRAWVASITRTAQVVCVPDPVTPVEAPQEGPRPNLVLFLSRLDPANGLFDLLEAVSGLRAAVPDVRLVCAGEGDRTPFARHAEHLGIRDAVSFTGWAGPSGKRALLESAAVFALPSYDQALPAGLLEAMGAGLPVVASPVGGVPEAVAEGVTGFLVAPGDVATLQRLLRKLLLDRALGARIGAAARESVRLRFAPERAVPRLEAVYAAVGLCALDAAPTPLRDAGVKGAA
jgi:glycosyltransferase involved in cell wall biosynthesis